jgi:site-specific DNA recombinase
MKAAIYARYSSEACSPTSITDQIASCRRLAERRGIEVLENHIYHDDAVSGARNDRSSLTALITAAQDGQFEAVLVDDLSRLSRSNLMTLHTVALFESLGITILSAADNIDTSDERSKMLIPLQGMINERFLADLREKTLRGMKGRKNEGYFVGERTFGYESTPSEKVRLDNRGKEKPAGALMRINEREAEVVRRVFRDFADGQSIFSIIKRLNKEGVRGRKNKVCRWSTQTIHTMLRNEKYKGVWTWNRTGYRRNPLTGKLRRYDKPQNEWDVKEFPEFRIVPEELWNRVQARLAEVRKTWPGGKRHGFQGARGNAVSVYPQELLSGAMVCGVCGATIVKVSGKGGGYYGCHRAAKHGCENRIIVRKKVVERVILGELSNRLSNTDSLAYVFRRVQQMVAKEFSESPGAAKRKEAEYKKQRQMLDNLVRYIAQGRQSKAIDEAIAECEKKVEQLGADLEFLNKGHTRLFKAPPKEWIEDRVSQIKEVLELKTERSALLLRRLLGRIIAEPAETEDGLRYLKAKTKLQCLALLEKEPAAKNPASLGEGVAAGSTTFRWRALRDSNPQPPDPKSGALSVELRARSTPWEYPPSELRMQRTAGRKSGPRRRGPPRPGR